MTATTNNYEILAPAGSIEQLIASVNNGCDAVYLGLDGFNARMKAPNFTRENLATWVDFCHFFGVKVFVAVNTSIKNNEFQSAVEMVDFAYNNNVDGVIVTDLALLKYCGSLSKPFEVVASTQLNVHDKYGAQFVKDLGATTVVCARECTKEDIAEIASVGVKVECFVHGALCVSQSGQCLFSSIIGGNSGNRGLCAQPCRKKYFCQNAGGASGYLLSTKDFCGLDVAKEMFDLGVSTYKIEGRNRRPEYAGMASKVYSELFADKFQRHPKQDLQLTEMYNRGNFVYRGYFDGDNGEIVYPKQQNHIGAKVGVVQGKGFVSTVYVAKGDGLKVLDKGVEVCGAIATSSGKGFVTAEFSGKVKNGMEVRRTSSVDLCSLVLQAKRKVPCAMFFHAKIGKPQVLKVATNNVIVEVQSEEITQKALSKPLQIDDIKQSLAKIGDLQYSITDIVVDIDDIFVAKSQINALRRQALELLTQQVVAQYNKQFQTRTTKGFVPTEVVPMPKGNNCLAVTTTQKERVEALQGVADFVVYKPAIINKTHLETQSFCYVDLPPFCNLQHLEASLCPNNGLVCHNVGQVQFARQHNIAYIAGSGLNVFNDGMAQTFADAKTFVYSHELSLAEIDSFKRKNGLTFVDGEIVLMKLVHCPFKVAVGSSCDKCKGAKPLEYLDELGNKFVIKRRIDKSCSFEVVNGKKLSVVGKLNKGGRYILDDGSALDHYLALNQSKPSNYQETQQYTKGRLYKKIN